MIGHQSLRARGPACAGIPPLAPAGSRAALSYVVRSYRRFNRRRRRRDQDRDLVLAIGAFLWLLVVSLASGWAMQGGA